MKLLKTFCSSQALIHVVTWAMQGFQQQELLSPQSVMKATSSTSYG